MGLGQDLTQIRIGSDKNYHLYVKPYIFKVHVVMIVEHVGVIDSA